MLSSPPTIKNPFRLTAFLDIVHWTITKMNTGRQDEVVLLGLTSWQSQVTSICGLTQ